MRTKEFSSSADLLPKEIRPDSLYPHKEAMSRVGWGKASYRKARRNGLPVKYLSKRAFIRGGDLIDYIWRNGVERN